MIWVVFFYLTWRGGLGSLIWIQSVQHEGKFSFLEALECFHSIAFFSPGAFIIMQSTPTRNFKYTTSFNKTNEIIHIHCISTEMLCWAMMSPYKVSTNQVLWSEPTLLTLGESRIEAAACFSVITDRIPEISHPKKKGISAAWLCPCWGLEQMSPLHSCTLITSTPLWRLQLGLLLLFQLPHGDEPEGYVTCRTVLWFSSFSPVLERYSTVCDRANVFLRAVQASRDVH